METPSSLSETDNEEFGTAITDVEADSLMEKYMRGETLNDQEQAKFNRIFVDVG